MTRNPDSSRMVFWVLVWLVGMVWLVWSGLKLIYIVRRFTISSEERKLAFLLTFSSLHALLTVRLLYTIPYTIPVYPTPHIIHPIHLNTSNQFKQQSNNFSLPTLSNTPDYTQFPSSGFQFIIWFIKRSHKRYHIISYHTLIYIDNSTTSKISFSFLSISIVVF